MALEVIAAAIVAVITADPAAAVSVSPKADDINFPELAKHGIDEQYTALGFDPADLQPAPQSGGSADAYGAHLPTAGEYDSPGSFVPQARPLNERAAIWMCIGEAGMLGA